MPISRRELFLDHGRVTIECPRLMSDEELAEVLAAFVETFWPDRPSHRCRYRHHQERCRHSATASRADTRLAVLTICNPIPWPNIFLSNDSGRRFFIGPPQEVARA